MAAGTGPSEMDWSGIPNRQSAWSVPATNMGRYERGSTGICDSGMRTAGVIVGSALALMGAVWALQGLNSRVVPQSFMTNNRGWIVIGVLTLLGGLALAQWSWTRR
jgi:hypothetical protein